jgi:hypothetical protein
MLVTGPRHGYGTVPRLYNLRQTRFTGVSDPANRSGVAKKIPGGE